MKKNIMKKTRARARQQQRTEYERRTFNGDVKNVELNQTKERFNLMRNNEIGILYY